MEYYPAHVTFTVDDPTFVDNDYAKLFSNSGSGAIAYVTPYNSVLYDLYDPSYSTGGWGIDEWGLGAWGYGYTEITTTIEVSTPGDWLFAFLTYDSLGNTQI